MTDLANSIMLGVLYLFAVFLGLGQQMTSYAVKKYAYQCSWKEETSKAYVRRIENVLPFAGMVGMAWSGTYFWLNDKIQAGGSYTDPAIFNDYIYY